MNINSLIDTISKEARVVYSDIADDFHVSGHGSQNDLKLLISLTNPRFYYRLAVLIVRWWRIVNSRDIGYMDESNICGSSKEIIFTQNGFRVGKSAPSQTYMWIKFQERQLKYIILDRQKIAKRRDYYSDKDRFTKRPVVIASEVILHGITLVDHKIYAGFGRSSWKAFSRRAER